MTPKTGSAIAWFEEGTAPGIRRPGDRPRWERCVEHRGAEVRDFARAHFGEDHRQILLIGGAGFDPRSIQIANLLTSVAGGRVTGHFLRERRRNPDAGQLAEAEEHVSQLKGLLGAATFVDLQVFDSDGAVVVGRHVVDAVSDLELNRYADVVIDFSALSIGTSFPLTRLILERIESGKIPINLHAMVTARPRTDARIVASPSAFVGPIHGFQGRFGIDETSRAAKLWIPQLRISHRGILERIHDFVNPDDIVPVLPFPSDEPLVGDRLIEEYAVEFENRWSVDARNIVYAEETNPLDFYRTVLRIDDARFPVFETTGGSLLILSPIGSKSLAIGGMMAAMERDLPVVYVEALSFSTTLGGDDNSYSDDDLAHVWLIGDEVYPATIRRDAASRPTQ